MKTTILFWIALVALLLLCGCNEAANNVSEVSRGEISEAVSDEKDLSEIEAFSGVPEESGEAGVSGVSDGGISEASADGGSEEEVSNSEGVFEIDGCYYLKPERATEAVTGTVDEDMFVFSDFESMAAFMQKKEYTRAERENMAQYFAKDKYGIRLGDINRVLFPTAEGFEVKSCAWFGADLFSYYMENGDRTANFRVKSQTNQLNEHREYMDDMFRYERLVMNPRTFNHKLTKEVKDGIEYFDVEWETSTHYQRKGYFDFVKDGVSYNVYISYSSAAKSEGKKSSDESLNEILYIQIIATGEKAEWICTLKRHDESAINPDYIASFGWKEIDISE